MTNGGTILITTIILALVTTPWWLGALYGLGMGVVACLVAEAVEALLRSLEGRDE